MRDRIISEAKSWLLTPYRDCQSVKGSGVDCGRFPLAVYSSLGLIPNFDPGYYSTQICLHKSAEQQRQEGIKPYIDFVRENLRKIEEFEVRPGDLVIYFVAKAFAHCAIIVNWPTCILHAVNPHGVVVHDTTRSAAICRRRREFYTPFRNA